MAGTRKLTGSFCVLLGAIIGIAMICLSVFCAVIIIIGARSWPMDLAFKEEIIRAEREVNLKHHEQNLALERQMRLYRRMIDVKDAEIKQLMDELHSIRSHYRILRVGMYEDQVVIISECMRVFVDPTDRYYRSLMCVIDWYYAVKVYGIHWIRGMGWWGDYVRECLCEIGVECYYGGILYE